MLQRSSQRIKQRASERPRSCPGSRRLNAMAVTPAMIRTGSSRSRRSPSFGACSVSAFFFLHFKLVQYHESHAPKYIDTVDCCSHWTDKNMTQVLLLVALNMTPICSSQLKVQLADAHWSVRCYCTMQAIKQAHVQKRQRPLWMLCTLPLCMRSCASTCCWALIRWRRGMAHQDCKLALRLLSEVCRAT